MLRLWLNRLYDTETNGMPTVQRLSDAVGHNCGGRNKALAEEVCNTWDFEAVGTISKH